MLSATASLRDEFPALALTLGFAPPQRRAHWADLLLLWLEVNRARNAAESMIAAARITWWREALDNQKPEGVPLAERLLSSGADISAISTMLNNVVGITLNAGPDSESQICHAMGEMLSTLVVEDDKKSANQRATDHDYAHTLLAFRAAMGGDALTGETAQTLMAAPLPTSFKLMLWLAEKPERLNYPEAQTLLPLKMLFHAIRL